MGAQQLTTRTIARVFFTLVGLAVLLYVLYLVRSVIGLILIAVFLAIALGPAVDFFHRRRTPRPVAILTVYLIMFCAIFAIGSLMVPPVVDQVQNIAHDAPSYISDLRDNRTLRRYDDRYHVSKSLTDQAKNLPSRLDDAAGALQSVTLGVFATLIQLLTVLTICFFLLKDGRRITEFAYAQLPPEQRPRVQKIAEDVYRSVGGYVAGALTIGTICGLVTWITLTILGVPFAVPLSVLMAFLALIPLVGATIGGVIIGLVTLLHDFPTDTIAWIVVVVVYQQIENNVLQPMVYRRTVDLHALVIISAILIGSSLLGVLGALVAIPIAAAVQIVLRDIWAYRRTRSGLVGTDEEPLRAEAPPPLEISRG